MFLCLPEPRKPQEQCLIMDVRNQLAMAMSKHPYTHDLGQLTLNCVEEYVHSSRVTRIEPLASGLGWKVWYWY